MVKHYADLVATVPDFPKPGVNFLDIGPVLADPGAMRHVTQDFRRQLQQRLWKPSYLVALDARGFLFASHLAAALDIGTLMCRKVGKLPGETVTTTYTTEYSQATFQMQKGLAPAGAKVVLVDDILATGGSLVAAANLSEQLGLEVLGSLVFIDLQIFKDAPTRPDHPVGSLLRV